MADWKDFVEDNIGWAERGSRRPPLAFAKELSTRQKVKVDFQCDGVPSELPKEISLCLYRALQEALQNAIKHRGSEKFRVSLNLVSDDIHLLVRDWGIGFDPEEAVKGPGLGLTSMRDLRIWCKAENQRQKYLAEAGSVQYEMHAARNAYVTTARSLEDLGERYDS